MLELILGMFTAGGSAGFGSMLKIVGGFLDSMNRAREVKAEAEFLREGVEHDQAIEFQKTLMGTDNYARGTRRIVAVIGMLTLSFITIFSTIFPELQLITFAREAGDWSFLFGAISIPLEAKTVEISLGHIAVVAATVVYPMIIGFYFTPGGRK